MSAVIDALAQLRASLDAVDLRWPLDSADDARATQHELVGQIDDYLMPRLAQLDAPLLVVFGGSTGSGKSTITNSLVGADVSLAGVLRPSTRTPVLVCNPADRAWFLDGGVLPDLPRSTGERPTGAGLHLVEHAAVPAGLGLLDAPDIDSVETANHELATQLLGAGDVWLFVTTASRYADAVPWEYLRRARERAVAMAIVVNRVPAGATTEVLTHLGDMLHAEQLADVPLFGIEESTPTAAGGAGLIDGRISPDDLAAVRGWLHDLVANEDRRSEVMRTTLGGAVDSIPARISVVRSAAAEQVEASAQLHRVSVDRYEHALGALDGELANGVLLRGEVLDRWREHVGTSAFMDKLQHGVSRIRARLGALFTGKPVPTEAAKDQLESNLATLVQNHADRAALATVSEWDTTTAGSAALTDAPRGLDRPSAGLAERLDAELDGWHAWVLELVEARAGNKLAVARVLSLGLNGIGVAVMIGVFSQTGGVTGAEAGVAAGTAAVSQTLLTAVFGENAVRDLVKAARDDLRLRLAGVFEVERARFDSLIGPTDADVDLEAAADAVLDAWRNT